MIYILRNIIFSLLFSSIVFSQCNDSVLGDSNNDNVLDVLDIVQITNMIFDDANNNIYFLDINQDNILNVIDVVILINYILNVYLVESDIINIDYDFNQIIINWNKSLNYGFEKYNIYYSNFFDNQEVLLYSTDNIDDTSTVVLDIDLKEQNFFWVSFEDFLECQTIGQQYFYELPYKSYLLNSVGDIISTEFNVTDFQSAFECADCHEEHVNEWSSSMHAYTMHNPVFFSYKEQNKDIHPGTGEKFCMQCHNPVSFLSDVDLSMYNNPEDFQNSNIDQVLKEGITCDVCHTKTGLSESVHAIGNMSANALYKMYPNQNLKFGSLQSPQQNEYHQSFYLPTFESSQSCLPCHDLVINNIEAEVTFTEWNRIPGFSMFGGVSCQDCHMPIKDNGYHDHRFIGVDLDLSIPFNDNPSYNDVQQLLSTSATLEFNILNEELLTEIIAGDTLYVPLSIESQTAHNFPSGTSFNREAWVEISVSNGDSLIYSSGMINNYEDLDYTDNQLLVFKSYLYDQNNEITHNVTEVDSMVNLSLAPYQSRYKYYAIPTSNEIEGDLFVTARLLFRSFSPVFIIEHHPEFLENLPVFEVDSISQIITIQQ